MALVNHSKKEINAKIVYFGLPGSGKGAALNYIFSRIKPSLRGELKNLPTGADNLLFFDFSPFDGPLCDGYRVRLHVYTLTGRVTNPATWKMTLKGADGLVILTDTSPERMYEVRESISQLRGFLSAYGVGLNDISAILQLNRFNREQTVVDAEQLAYSIDMTGLPCSVSCVDSGEGVLEALATLSRLVLDRVTEHTGRRNAGITEPVAGDVDSILELSDETSGEDDWNSQDISPQRALTGVMPPVSLACRSVSAEGTVLRIPVEMSCGGNSRRLVVSVSIDME